MKYRLKKIDVPDGGKLDDKRLNIAVYTTAMNPYPSGAWMYYQVKEMADVLVILITEYEPVKGGKWPYFCQFHFSSKRFRGNDRIAFLQAFHSHGRKQLEHSNESIPVFSSTTLTAAISIEYESCLWPQNEIAQKTQWIYHTLAFLDRVNFNLDHIKGTGELI